MDFDVEKKRFFGSGGTLSVLENDDVAYKFAMLIKGECEGLGPKEAAKMFNYSRQRYFQLRNAFKKEGIMGLVNKPKGPQRNYRCTEEVVCQTIRHRFLDPDVSAEVIAQKMKQLGFKISVRSVERILNKFGLQKKTLQILSQQESGTRKSSFLSDP